MPASIGYKLSKNNAGIIGCLQAQLKNYWEVNG